MFQWTQRDGSKRWILESESFPYFVSFGRWNNPNENQGEWHYIMPNKQGFLAKHMTEDEVKHHLENRAIELLLDSAEEIRTINL